VIILSEAADTAVLKALGVMMNGGTIELLSGEGATLGVMKLGNPAGKRAADGALEFNAIGEEDAAPTTGQVTTARILGADGGEVFLCDVGDESSSAAIKFDNVEIRQGDPVPLISFKLKMP
jgi:hypothetical protein